MSSRKFLMMILIPWFFCTHAGCEYDDLEDGSDFEDGEQFGSRSGDVESGLVGAYFNNKDFTSQALERVDATINFDWGKGTPNSKIGTDTFSVRWKGFVEAKFSQTYTFYTVADDGIKLWVDNKLVVDDWSNHGPRERSGTISLLAGKKYSIKLEYYEDAGGAVAKLLWSSPSQGKQIIPKERLFTSDVIDQCPGDPNKINPGQCGCGIPEGSCGNDANVARGKSTRQSSTAYGGVSSRAVDGNTSGNWSDGSITHTERTAAPWWIVDLGASHQLSGVTLWNRTNCCSERLSNLHVDYLGQNGNVIATKTYSAAVGAMANIDLAANGVYSVRIQLNGTNYLSLAEVEVWGSVGGGGGSLCAEANENQSASLSCQSGKTINSIKFASYGLPTGSCETGFATSTCHASSSKSKVEASCLHKQSCSVTASNSVFGDPCSGKFKKIAITYTCIGGTVDQCPDDPNKTEPGKCGCGKKEGTCDKLTFPIRGAFYYPWFPQTWTVQGKHVFYEPLLGYYSSDDTKAIDQHIRDMDYAKIDVAIASWWGIGKTSEDKRVPSLLNRTLALGSNLKWAFYYEKEGFANPSVTELKKDLDYLMQKYSSHQALARVNGKPVVFVYSANDGTCDVANRWSQASSGKWYVVLKIFGGFKNCATQPDSWHQYGPDAPAQHHPGYSYVIAPGFWRADQSAPLLKRDINRWRQNVSDMVASGAPWQLITTFNEWGEGTAVEPAKEWQSNSGYGHYLDALHNN